MHVVTYSQARANLKALMDRAVDDCDRVIITRQRGRPVVMMALDDLEAMDETLYLTSTEANRRALQRSLEDFEAGRVVHVDPETMQPID